MLEGIQGVAAQVGSIVVGKNPQIRLAMACLLARGHLLIEDLPGVGKTTLAHALAISLGLDFKRVQFTNDLLPADITGATIYRRDSSQFTFMPGPVFSQMLLADEINRASPKTQSALLEAMEERQVSVEGKPHKLPQPFFVIATQNPQDQIGTWSTTSRTFSRSRGARPTSRKGSARAPASACCRRRAPGRCSTGAITCCPTTSRQ